MAEERWEQERGAWVLAHAGRRPGARRRGEKLLVAARRRDRHDVGAGDAAFSEVTTRNLFHRMVHREDGAANAAGWFILAVAGSLVGAALVGPALLVSRAAYGLWWWQVPRWGRMRAWPYLALAAVLALAGWLALSWSQLAGTQALLAGYLLAQLVLGIAWAAWLVRARGWAAVARRQRERRKRVHMIKINVPEQEPQDDYIGTPMVTITRSKDKNHG